MNKVIIVVPQYKSELTSMETFALNQLEKFWGGGYRYNISFVCPKRLKEEIEKQHPTYIVEPFDDDYFLDLNTYNKLCFSKDFYERFSKYEYMLICHLDGFVFSDRLEEFLDMGYDYIGAPWPSPAICGKKRLYVGNGGFSLRRVQAFIDAVNNYGDWMNVWYDNEDCFFAYLGKVKGSNFRVAPLKVASNFAWEIFPERNYKKTKKLPFGCHGFHKWDFGFYLNLFIKLGYDVAPFADESLNKKTITVPAKYGEYVFRRLERNLKNGGSFAKYLPQADAPVFCCLFSSGNSPVLQALYNEGYPMANPENIIVYDRQNVEALVSDFKQVNIFRLIVNFECDDELIKLLEENGIVYGRDYISFWREYLLYELKLLRKIVSPQSTGNIDYEIQFYV